MSEDIKLEVIKSTQDSLGKFIKKPVLTEKLLKKPPFRFLHDIVTNVIRDTGFLSGLYSDLEMQSDNVKDKEAKIVFLQKLIECLHTVTGKSITARPSKIVAGLEPTKTNEMLQMIGYALNKKLNSSEAIAKTKPTKPKEKEKSVSKPKNEKIDKPKITPASNNNNKVKKIDNNVKTVVSKKINEEKKVGTKLKEEPKKGVGKKKESKPNLKSVEIKEDVKENEPSPKPVEIITQAESVIQIQNEEELIKPEEINAENEQKTVMEEELSKTETQDDEKLSLIENDLKTETKEPEPEPELLKPKEPNNFPIRPRTATLRPPSVRPSSARPGAPRLKDKTDVILPPDELVPMGKVNVIVETFNVQDDDNEETVTVEPLPDENIIIQPVNSDLPTEKGHLVSQILEQLQDEENVVVVPLKPRVEIEWQSGGGKNREIASKEMERLKDSIQTLTRAVNPLGKLMNFLQEDVDAMHSELKMWRDINEKLVVDIRREEKLIQELNEPLKQQLSNYDNEIRKQYGHIAITQANVLRNEQKIKMLLTRDG